METSGRRSDGEADDSGEGLTKWPLEYVKETKECICGWCGHVFLSDYTHDDLEMHFQSCKNSEETALLTRFKDLLNLNHKFEGLNADLRTRVDQMKAELMEEIKAELHNIKAEVKKDLLKANRETSDAVLSTLLNKVNILEDGMQEKMRELGAAQETKMAEVSGRVSGVTETISSVVQSMTEAKSTEVTPSADNELYRAVALGLRQRKSTGNLASVKTHLEDEAAHLKSGTEPFSVQFNTHAGDHQVLKRQMEGETSKSLAKKMKGFHVEPSAFDQFTIPMNCFNLVVHNYLFQPSYKWIIDGIKSITAQKTFELSSEMFQWNGYPIQARAKFQLREDGGIYLSMCLKDDGESRDFKVIPQLYYLLKNVNSRNPQHKCSNRSYLLGSKFKHSFVFEAFLCRKSLFNNSDYNVNDSIEIEMYVEPPAMTRQVHSYDGTLEWSIENYRKKLQFEKNRLVFYQESPYFYTGPNGYRVQVRLMLNGDEGGSGPTARVLFWTSKYDAQLPKSFAHSTTVTLINCKEPEKSVTKTVVEDIKKKKDYKFEICKLEEIKNVIENDTLLCKVVIKAQ